MPLPIANRVQLSVIREVTFGQTPTTPAYQVERYTSSALAGTVRSVTSAEILADRQVSDAPLVGISVGGDVGVEWSALSHDILLEAALFGTWARRTVKDNHEGSEITAVGASAYTTTTAVPAWAAGMIVVASGFTNTGNNRTVVAAAGSSGTSVAMTGGVVEAAPPATARLKHVGWQGASGDITATTTGLGSTTMDFTTLGLVVGLWMYVGGPTAGTKFATAPSGWCRISAIAANALTFDIKPTGWTTDAGTGKTINLYVGDYVRNGTTQYSHTIEEAHLDTSVYQYFRGMVVQGLTLAATAQQIVTGGFSFMGGSYEATATRIPSSSFKDAFLTPVLNATANVARLAEAGAILTAGPNYILAVGLTLANNLREQNAVASLGAIGIGAGRVDVTGTLSAYFGDVSMLTKLIANTDTSLDMAFRDTQGNALLFDLPRVKLSAGSAPVRGINTDVMSDLTFTALKHPTLGYTIHVQSCEGAGT